jgi:hypothetical protein
MQTHLVAMVTIKHTMFMYQPGQLTNSLRFPLQEDRPLFSLICIRSAVCKTEAGTGGRFLRVKQHKRESGEPRGSAIEEKFLGPRGSPSLSFTYLLRFYELCTHMTDRPRLHYTPVTVEYYGVYTRC